MLCSSMTANEQIVQELIGDDSIYEALMEIMEPRMKGKSESRYRKLLLCK